MEKSKIDLAASLCVLVGAGPVSCPDDIRSSVYGNAKAYICAIDGGFDTLQGLGIKPDLFVGDFDSALAAKDTIARSVAEIASLPQRKDQTDLEAALTILAKRGARSFRIYGALGGDRLDFALSNIQVAAGFAARGLKTVLIDEFGTGKAEFLNAGEKLLLQSPSGKPARISVMSLADNSAVAIKGLEYEYEGPLTSRTSRGLSNRTKATCEGSIECRSGLLVVFRANI